METSNTRRGGVRPGAGRLRQTIHISLDHARMLAVMTSRWREQFPDIDEHRVVELLITQQAMAEAEEQQTERSGQG